MRSLHLVLLLLPLPLLAQEPVRVTRVAPRERVRPTDAITVTFDRPLFEDLATAPPAGRVVRLEPAVPAVVTWRTPAVLHVRPTAPLAPGARYTLVVDTPLVARDGGRLAQPVRTPLRVRGVELLASEPGLVGARAPVVLDGGGRVLLAYSAPVDTARFSRVARLELRGDGACRARIVRLQVARSDTIGSESRFSWAGDAVDPVAAGMRREVELRPASALPAYCAGDLVLPSTDADDRPELRWRVTTSPPLAIAAVRCEDGDQCVGATRVQVQFTAPVRRSEAARHVRVSGALARAPIVDQEGAVADSLRTSPWWSWTVAPVAPRSTVRVTVDAALRDVWGRAWGGRTRDSILVGDRAPALGWDEGLVTIPRGAAALRLRHVNVDSVEVAWSPVDRDGFAAELQRWRTYGYSHADSAPRRAGTIRSRHALAGALNDDRLTTLPVPAAVSRAGGAWHVQVTPLRVSREVRTPVALPESGRPWPWPRHRPLLVQVSGLAAHLRADAEGGAVLVTALATGLPVAGATAALRRADGVVVARGTSDATGVARLEATAAAPADADDDDEQGRRRGPRPSDRESADAREAGMLIEVAHGDDGLLAPLELFPYTTSWRDPFGSTPYWSRRRPVLARAAPWTSRDLYRPGEVVHLAAALRDGPLGALRAPAAGDSARIRVTSLDQFGDEATVRDTVLRLAGFGTVADSFALRPGARLGEYAVHVDRVQEGAWREAGRAGFRVAEFRPPAFRVALRADSGVLLAGDTLRATLTGGYLFGEPMRGAQVAWRMSVRELPAWEVRLPGLDASWTIGEGWTWWDASSRAEPRTTWSSGTDSLGADGTRRLAIPTADGVERTRPSLVSLHADVVDADRQRLSATATATLHAADLYLAVRDSARAWWWTVGTRRAIEVAAVRADGRRVAGVPVSATVVRHRWSAGPWEGAGRMVEDTIARLTMRTGDPVATLAMTPTAEGSIVVRLEATDAAGRPVRAALHGYAFGRGGWGGWGDNPVAVPVLARRAGGGDRGAAGDTLAAGDSLELRFVSPWRGEAWVTVERERLLESRRLTIDEGASTVRLAVPAGWAPGVTATVTLVRHGAAWTRDSLHQRLRVGTVVVPVSTAPSRLAVRVTPARREWTPGDSAEVTVQVHDAVGRPARAAVTLWAVDEGVLALSTWTPPDLDALLHAPVGSALAMRSTLATLHALRPALRLALDEARRRGGGIGGVAGALALQQVVVAEQGYAVAAAAPGGDRWALAANEPPRLRTTFRSTAFWRGGLATGADGTVRLRVAMPDNLTTWRLVAVSVGEGDAYGTGEDTVRTTQPLQVRAALPRFVRAGDSLIAGALVTARDTAAATAVVRATAAGLARADTGARTAALAGGRTAEARWAWRATGGTEVRAEFAATSGAHADAVEAVLPVRPTGRPRVHALSGIARGRTPVRMVLPRELDPARSQLVLRVGSSPLPVVEAAHAWLRAYPYACSEQLASTGRTIVALLQLRAAGLADTAGTGTLRAELQRAVDELSRRQRGEGGIGYWSRDSWTAPSLTAQVGLLLLDARDLGATVDAGVLAGIRGSLDRSAAEPRAGLDSAYGTRAERADRAARALGARLAAAAFARRAGTPDTSAEDVIAQQAATLTWEDRLWLATLLSSRRDAARASALLAAAWRDVRTLGARVELPDTLLRQYGFPSRVRPAARLLEATLAIAPSHPRLGALVETLVQQARAGRGWAWNTQDLAATAAALARVARRQPRGTVRVRVTGEGGATLVGTSARGGTRGDSVSVPLAGLVVARGDSVSLPLVVEGDGTPTFWTIAVHEVPRERPVTPDARGLVVERWYERLAGGGAVTEVAAGELVRVHLRIISTGGRDFVAVEDALPAGLEAVDAGLRGVGGQLEGAPPAPTAEGESDEDAGHDAWTRWWSPWEHSELRDDRVLFFARGLGRGSHRASYVARATTPGRFVRPPAHAEEMYNPAASGRSDGGWFTVRDAPASP